MSDAATPTTDLDSILDGALDDLDAPDPVPVVSASVPVPPVRPAAGAVPGLGAGAGAGMGLPPGLMQSLGVSGLGALSGGAAGMPFGPPPMPSDLTPGEAKELQELKTFLDSLSKTPMGQEFFQSLGPEAGMRMAELDRVLQSAPGAASTASASASASASSPASASSTATTAASAASPSATASAVSTATAGAGAGAGSASASASVGGAQQGFRDMAEMLSQGAAQMAAAGGGLPEHFARLGLGDLPPTGDAEFDEMMKKLLEEMQGAAGAGAGAAGAAGAGAAGAGAPGDSETLDKMVEKMMEKMLNKENLYPPMKEITAKFPGWLSEKKSKLSATEYKNYQAQYECFQRICVAFEAEPEDKNAVMVCMQEMQKFGPPPREIVSAMLPPGMELNEQGVPAFPGLPGMPPMDDAQAEAAFRDLTKNGCPTM